MNRFDSYHFQMNFIALDGGIAGVVYGTLGGKENGMAYLHS